jgi:hypothetical protein
MSLTSAIRQTLEGNLSNASSIPDDIAWENLNYDPTKDTAYLATNLIPTLSAVKTIAGPRRQVEHRGIFAVNIYTKTNVGPGENDTYVDAIMAAFKPGRPLSGGTTEAIAADTVISADTTIGIGGIVTGSGQMVYIERVNRTRGFTDGAFYMAQVEVNWYSFETVED